MEVSTLNSKENQRWLNGLDSIRFVLALIVMLGHISDRFLTKVIGEDIFLNIVIKLFHQLFCGPAAVIVFFVLSGIVIHYPNRNKSVFNIKTFLIRRIFRIGIPLLVVSLVGIYFQVFDSIPVWSLYCELIYYVIYPFIFALKVNWDWLFKVSFVFVFAILIIMNFDSVLSMLNQKNINYKSYYWSYGTLFAAFFGFPCWVAGAALANKIDKLTYIVSFKTLMAYRLTAYILSCVFLVLSFHFYIGYVFTLNFFAIFAVYWLEKEVIYYRSHKCNRVIEYAGKFSFTLYLWHMILFGLIKSFIPTTNLSFYLIYIFLITAISYLLYLLIEFPSQRLAQYVSNKFA